MLDTIPDNFGAYAEDGIADDWQVQHFGADNPRAGPDFISDSSGLTNLFKYVAGLVPNNSASTFTFNTLPVVGQPGQMDVTFGPTFADRNYTVQFSTDLMTWYTLYGPVPGTGGALSVPDTNLSQSKFYRVRMVKP